MLSKVWSDRKGLQTLEKCRCRKIAHLLLWKWSHAVLKRMYWQKHFWKDFRAPLKDEDLVQGNILVLIMMTHHKAVRLLAFLIPFRYRIFQLSFQLLHHCCLLYFPGWKYILTEITSAHRITDYHLEVKAQMIYLIICKWVYKWLFKNSASGENIWVK